MAPGPNAAAATPQRVNPVYQEIIDKGTPILLSSPTPLQPANGEVFWAGDKPGPVFFQVGGLGCDVWPLGP